MGTDPPRREVLSFQPGDVPAAHPTHCWSTGQVRAAAQLLRFLPGHQNWVGHLSASFPSPGSPGDDGWHVDARCAGPGGQPWLDVASTNRALLMLFLFSDVGPDDAPTRIRLGCHQYVPALLAPAGAAGRDATDVAQEADRASAGRPTALATGTVGDVWLWHPFLVHAAQPHRGTNPRFIAQPSLHPTRVFDLEASPRAPVVEAIHRALHPRHQPHH